MHNENGAPERCSFVLSYLFCLCRDAPAIFQSLNRNLPVCKLRINSETKHLREYHSLMLSKLTEHCKKSRDHSLAGTKATNSSPTSFPACKGPYGRVHRGRDRNAVRRQNCACTQQTQVLMPPSAARGLLFRMPLCPF